MRTSNSTHRVNPNVESKSRTVQLLPDLPPEQSTYKTFKFTASDNDWKHGSKWANGIMPIIAGAMICVMKPAIGVLFIVIGIIILVSFCTLQNMSCPTTYNISFDEEHYMVHLYSGSHLTHSFSYNNFAQLWFETREETYCIFVCLGCWIRAGTGTYCGGVVYAVMKNSKQYRINNSLCYGAHEFAHTKRMVARANRYYKVDRHNIRIQTYETIVVLQKEGETQKEETDGRVAKTDIDASGSLHIIVEKDDIINNNSIIMQTQDNVNININKELESEEEIEENRIGIGSYCYVDCDSVYGVVIGYLPNNYYTIVDLFEKRERRAFENSLTLIKDEKVLNEVNKQYKLYLKK